MKSNPVDQGGLETFLNLYGFCRNMALALLLVAACLTFGLILGSADTDHTSPPVGGWRPRCSPASACSTAI